MFWNQIWHTHSTSLDRCPPILLLGTIFLLNNKLLHVHICLCTCDWTNTCLEETLLPIITGLVPSICIEQVISSPCGDTPSVSRGQQGYEAGLTDLSGYHCDVVPQQCFSVKEFRCKNGTISRINVKYSVHICVSIHRIPENAK